MTKKNLLLAILMIVVFCGCNRKRFVNMMTGTWKINHYIFAQQDITATFSDTTHVNFQLVIDENQRYMRSWIGYAYKRDSIIKTDTLRYDSTTMAYIIAFDTIRFIDSTITPYSESGRWDLLNSQEDIQFTSDSAVSTPVEYRILKLQKNTFNILNGNEEYDLTK